MLVSTGIVRNSLEFWYDVATTHDLDMDGADSIKDGHGLCMQ